MLKKVLIALFTFSVFSYSADYKINEIIVNQIDGNRNLLAKEKSEFYDIWNNFNDFLIIAHVIGKDPQKEYFEDNRHLVLKAYDKNHKEVFSERVNTSYIYPGGHYHWFLIRNSIIGCGTYKIVAELTGQTKHSMETIVQTGCGE